MGGVASQPAVALPAGSQASLNVNRLASIASRYEQLKRDFTALGDEQESHAGALKEQRDLFRRQLLEFQKDFEAKLQEQQKRNADLNARERNVSARNSQLKERLAALESKQAANASSAANARAAAIQAASEAATTEKLRLEKIYAGELAEIEAPLKAAREEFARLSQQLQDLEAKTAEKPKLNAALTAARAERNALNKNITNKRLALANVNGNIQAAQSKVAAQIQQEEAKLPAKLAELEANLSKEIDASRAAKMEALELELAGIRKGEQEKTEALLTEAQAKAAEELARAAQEIAALRAKEESERSARLASETVELERQKAAAAKERADTEAAIRALEAKAATNAAAAAKLAEEKAELERIKAEQLQFESEKARILSEQTAAKEAAAAAQQEAAAARAEAQKAAREKAAADQERAKAEKVEKYRKHVYQIIKDWIGPLEHEGIRTFHDDEKDDYFFQHGPVTKDWVQEKTIQTLKRKYPGLKWQPRPSYNTFVGGRRCWTRRQRKSQRKTRKL